MAQPSAGIPPLKERLQIPRQKMSTIADDRRRAGFEEVHLGLSPEQARSEALRCLLCKDPQCVAACPIHNDIPRFLLALQEGREADAVYAQSYPFGSVCGRVCYRPCEGVCPRGVKAEPVAISALERFAADRQAERRRRGMESEPPSSRPLRAEKVAVAGSGPAGLMCAWELAQHGYWVTVFEKAPRLGGMLALGIPEYRLPQDVLERTLQELARSGVEFYSNVEFGKDVTVEGLRQKGFKAFFLAPGAWKGTALDVPGSDGPGVVDALSFLKEAHLGKKEPPGRKVIIIGGGDSAIDAARVSLRLGAEAVSIVYRRGRKEMPANPGEIEEAEHEGIRVELLTAPRSIVRKNGKMTAMECLRMKLGAPDASGRARPEPVPGSEFIIEADAVVAAIGQGVALGPMGEEIAPAVGKNARIQADGESQKTPLEPLWAGGDAVTGPKTVTEALAAGRRAAWSIHHVLDGERTKGEGVS